MRERIKEFFAPEDLRLGRVSPMEKVQRWLVLLQVCLCGLAYGQVEIPTILYTVYAYLSTAGYLVCQIHRPVKNWILLLIPITYLAVNIAWSIGFMQDIKPEPALLVLTAEFLLMSRESKAWIFVRFRRWIICMCGAGVVCYASYLLHLGLPYSLVQFYREAWNVYYANYHIAYVQSFSEGLGLMSFLPRLCGLYNEPGYLGTVCAMVLMAENLNLKRVGNIVIMLACVCTFSFAFWIIIALYWLFMSLQKPPRFFVKLAILASVVVWVQTVQFDDVAVQKVFDRFKIVDGKVQGDNRVTLQFDKVYGDMFLNNKELTGLGPEASARIEGNLSIKTYIMNFGLLGVLLAYGVTIGLAMQYAMRGRYPSVKMWVFFALYFISIYQRPAIFNPLYMGLLFGGLDYIERQNYLATLPPLPRRRKYKHGRKPGEKMLKVFEPKV